MNDNAKKLVAALRSGEYNQIQSMLRNPYGYCCLGVACDLYGKEHGVPWKHNYSVSFFLGESETLPREVIEWLGFRNCDGGFLNGKSLMDLNDSGSTFPEIADIIESEPPRLFVEQ